MPTENEPGTISDRDWIIRVQPPRSDAKDGADAFANVQTRSLLLLHGWTGDETVMWIFTRNLPGNYWIFAPRAPVLAPEGGYGWLPHKDADVFPRLAEFQEIAGRLLESFQRWAGDRGAPPVAFDIMGFSQGAAMAFALAAYFPQQVNQVMALAGFLPDEENLPGRYIGLTGKRIYVAHGTQDKTVSVQKAQQAVRILQSAGAQVTYCESEVGHKLSADCLRGLQAFLAKPTQ